MKFINFLLRHKLILKQFYLTQFIDDGVCFFCEIVMNVRDCLFLVFGIETIVLQILASDDPLMFSFLPTFLWCLQLFVWPEKDFINNYYQLSMRYLKLSISYHIQIIYKRSHLKKRLNCVKKHIEFRLFRRLNIFCFLMFVRWCKCWFCSFK